MQGSYCPGGGPIYACPSGSSTSSTGATSSAACNSQLRVLLLASEVASWVADLQAKLKALGAFSAVDYLDASTSTPPLSALQGYDALLVWCNGAFASAGDIGNVLADYWDGGGAVVLAQGSFYLGHVQGRFGTAANGYMLMDGNPSYEAPSDMLGQVLEPQSPLMAGVSSITASFAVRGTGAVLNGGVVVAQWASNGRPLVVRGTKAGRPLVAVNMYACSAAVRTGLWVGNGAELLRNALVYSATRSGTTPSLPPGSYAERCVPFHLPF